MFKYNSPPPESNRDSDYESDDGLGETRKFYPVAQYPSGNCADARLFKSSSDAETRVVLSPVSVDHFDSLEAKEASFEEPRRKSDFFKALYPQSRVRFIPWGNGSYRLILPEIPGVTYKKILLSDSSEVRSVMFSAVLALKDAHDKGYLTIDLKEDNILYDPKTGKSFLIDGGFSVKIGSPIPIRIFQCENQNKVDESRKMYFHLAPECWSTSTVMANELMDVYSLANMILRIAKKARIDGPLISVLERCSDLNPTNRPTLNDLIHFLMPEVTPVVQAAQPAVKSRAAALEERVFFQSPGPGRTAVDSPRSPGPGRPAVGSPVGPPPALPNDLIDFLTPEVTPVVQAAKPAVKSPAAAALKERVFFQSPGPGRSAVDSPRSPGPGRPAVGSPVGPPPALTCSN
jgi:hypothetical protein